MMRITVKDRMRALFARDEYEFWWRQITNEEKKLSQMDVWELAKVINKNGANSPESIVAEHMLNVRLTKMQVRATYINIVFVLIGTIVGAFLTSILK